MCPLCGMLALFAGFGAISSWRMRRKKQSDPLAGGWQSLPPIPTLKSKQDETAPPAAA